MSDTEELPASLQAQYVIEMIAQGKAPCIEDAFMPTNYHVVCNDGTIISIQYGSGRYSTDSSGKRHVLPGGDFELPATSFELMVDTDKSTCTESYPDENVGDVVGYASQEQVIEIMTRHGGFSHYKDFEGIFGYDINLNQFALNKEENHDYEPQRHEADSS